MTSLKIQAIGSASSVPCDLLGNASLSRAGGTSASASSGEGGWQVVDRSRQKASTVWLDYYPFVMTMNCILDGGTGTAPKSVETHCLVLEGYELPVPGSRPPLPPRLKVTGPVPHADLVWVCSRLEFPDGETAAIRNAKGTRTQQKFTLELTEFSPSQPITTPALSPAQRAQATTTATTTPSGRTYTVKKGDTLQSIAAKFGNATLWRTIASLNGLSPSAVLLPGEVLLLPSDLNPIGPPAPQLPGPKNPNNPTYPNTRYG